MSLFFENEQVRITRRDKSLIAELKNSHRTLSTSYINGGIQSRIRNIVNNQCVEGKKHVSLGEQIVELGQQGFNENICSS